MSDFSGKLPTQLPEAKLNEKGECVLTMHGDTRVITADDIQRLKSGTQATSPTKLPQEQQNALAALSGNPQEDCAQIDAGFKKFGLKGPAM